MYCVYLNHTEKLASSTNDFELLCNCFAFFFFFQGQNIPLCLEKLAHRSYEYNVLTDPLNLSVLTSYTTHMYAVRTYFMLPVAVRLREFQLYTAVSRKVVGKSVRDNAERLCG